MCWSGLEEANQYRYIHVYKNPNCAINQIDVCSRFEYRGLKQTANEKRDTGSPNQENRAANSRKAKRCASAVPAARVPSTAATAELYCRAKCETSTARTATAGAADGAPVVVVATPEVGTYIPVPLAEARGNRHSITSTVQASVRVSMLPLLTPSLLLMSLLLPILLSWDSSFLEQSSQNAGSPAGGIHTNASFSEGCRVTAGHDDDDGKGACVLSLGLAVVLARCATKKTTKW